MKKWIVSLLALIFALSFVSCGNEPDDVSSVINSDTSSAESASSEESAAASEESSAVSVESKTSSAASSKASSSKASSSKASSSKSSSSKASSSKASSVTSSKVSSVSTEKFSSISAYLNAPEVKAVMDQLIETLASSGLNLKITGEGNKLVYSYTFAQQIDAAATKPALEEGLEAQAATFQMTAKELLTYVEVKNPAVVVRYLNADGSLILEKQFTAK